MKLAFLNDAGATLAEVDVPLAYFNAVKDKRTPETDAPAVRNAKTVTSILRNGMPALSEIKRPGSLWWDHQLKRTGWTADKAHEDGVKALEAAPDAP